LAGTFVTRRVREELSKRPSGRALAVWYWGVMVATLVCAACGNSGRTSHRIFTNTKDLRELPAGQVRPGIGVRIEGILTFYDPLSHHCFVQDATGGVAVDLLSSKNVPMVGHKVAVSGVAANGGVMPSIVGDRLIDLGPGGWLEPAAVTGPFLRDPQYLYKRVAVSGVVRSVSSERVALVTVEILAQGVTVRVNVPASALVINDGWVDADVRASGVLAESLDAGGNAGDPILWAADTDAVQMPYPPRPPGYLPVTPIRHLLGLRPGHLPAHRVRIAGVPSLAINGGLGIVDDSGQIPVRLERKASGGLPGKLDVAGFLVWKDDHALLDQAVTANSLPPENQARAPEAGATLTTALQVHSLSKTAAQAGYPVRIRAVVTYFDAVNHLLFVQDSTDGIFVETSENLALRAGDLVDVTGVTTADFAPDVANAHVKVAGRGHLPAPSSTSFQSAVRGREDCRWIDLGGIVQQVVAGEGDALLTLVWGRERYKAHVLAPVESLAPLVDSEVRVQGVCGSLFNAKRQMLGIQMFVPEKRFITVTRPAPPDPFALPPSSIEQLMQYSRTREMGHRVRLFGTVTYGNRAGLTWIRDATGGLVLRDLDTRGLQVGDAVEVVGFPAIAGFSPVLNGSEARRLRAGPPPGPVRITAGDAMRGSFDGQLVRIEGKLLDWLQQPTGHVLAVSSGGVLFDADLPNSGGTPAFEPGSFLRLTGICSVEVEQSRDLILPRTFRLLLRSPADVEVVGRPPWVTANRVFPALAAAMLLVIAALAWVGLLHRRVRVQTEVLQAQTLQLKAAHQRTQSALQKAREAEALDLDSKRIVELIARDEPVDLIIDHIAEAVALHSESAVCAILLSAPQGMRVFAVPALPTGWLEALGRLDLNSISFSTEYREPRRFSDSANWAGFIDSQPSLRFKAFCLSPIVVDSVTEGVIAAFFRHDKPCTDAQGEQLALWSNIAALALDRRRLHDQLSFRAQHDGLTGLPNRAYLYDRMESEIALASHVGGLLGVLYLDLDNFKGINDTYGHSAGDAVLQQVARRMIQSVRRGDTVARIGGDEFVVLLPRLSRREDAEQIAVKIETALREPVLYEQQKLNAGASVGVSIWPFDGNQPDVLLQAADSHMYGQKRRRWYDPVSPPAKSSETAQAGRAMRRSAQ